MAIPTLSGGITNAGNTLSNADSTAGWSGTFIGTDLDIKVEGTADQDVIIVIFDVDYLPLRLEDVLGSTSRSIKVEQVFDRNYDEGATPLVNP